MKNLEVYKKQLEGKFRCKVFDSTLTNEFGTVTPIKVAVLLEYFLASQGASNEDAIHNLNEIINSTLYANDHYNHSALEWLKPAPQKYWDKEAVMEFTADPFDDPGNL